MTQFKASEKRSLDLRTTADSCTSFRIFNTSLTGRPILGSESAGSSLPCGITTGEKLPKFSQVRAHFGTALRGRGQSRGEPGDGLMSEETGWDSASLVEQGLVTGPLSSRTSLL